MKKDELAPGESQNEHVDILNLSGWQILEEYEEEHLYRFTAKVLAQASSCPLCGAEVPPYRFGIREHEFADLPMHGKQVRILAKRRRYRCKVCHKTFLDPASHMSEQHSATTRLVNHIERETLSLSSRTFLSLGYEIGVTEDTVRHIFDTCVHRLEQARTIQTPTVLGIDELHLLGAPRCILTDIRGKTVIDLLTNRNQETVIKWLRQMPEKNQIQVVTMDMWQPYRNAVREVLPQASIIVDKFHVVKMANEALEQVRKTIRASLTDAQRRSLMRDRYILLKRQRDLTVKDQLVLEAWTANFPNLGKAYMLKEGFFSIWDASTKDDAHERYFAWMAQITPEIADAFLPLALTVENWGDEIFSYWDYNGTISNAFTEAKNGALKVANRVGRGYSLSVIRAKVLFAEEIALKYPRHKKPFQPRQETEEG
jgi:transposase